MFQAIDGMTSLPEILLKEELPHLAVTLFVFVSDHIKPKQSFVFEGIMNGWEGTIPFEFYWLELEGKRLITDSNGFLITIIVHRQQMPTIIHTLWIHISTARLVGGTFPDWWRNWKVTSMTVHARGLHIWLFGLLHLLGFSSETWCVYICFVPIAALLHSFISIGNSCSFSFVFSIIFSMKLEFFAPF